MTNKEFPPHHSPDQARQARLQIDNLLSAAIAFHQAGNVQQAEATYRQVLLADPNNLDALNLLGVLLTQTRRLDEAELLISKAIALNNKIPVLHFGLANTLKEKGQLEDAVMHYQEAIRLNPNYLEAYVNLGNAFSDLNMLDMSVESFQTALRIQPGSVSAHNNLGAVLLMQGKGTEAADHLRTALRQRPNDAKTHCNLSQALCLSGHLLEAWREHEWRLKRHNINLQRDCPAPIWSGEDLAGQTILIRAEQGVGDEIMFANVFQDIIDVAGHCVVECDPRLVPLFMRSFASVEVVPNSSSPHPRIAQPDINLQVAAGSLPKWFRPSVESFPNHDGYLMTDPARVAFWKQRLAELGPQPKVGICWRSKLQSRDRALFYTKLTQWGSIFAVPGLAFVNLQYDDCQAELEEAENLFGTHIHTWNDIDLMHDLDEVAALIKALDLVISAGTAVAQMAGALGIPVWEFSSDANWTALGTGKSPWYPSMRLFNRRWNEPWDGIIANLARELAQKTSAGE